MLALGQLRLADDPTEALAFATASLELADSQEARRLRPEGARRRPARDGPRRRRLGARARLQPRRTTVGGGRPFAGGEGLARGRERPGRPARPRAEHRRARWRRRGPQRIASSSGCAAGWPAAACLVDAGRQAGGGPWSSATRAAGRSAANQRVHTRRRSGPGAAGGDAAAPLAAGRGTAGRAGPGRAGARLGRLAGRFAPDGESWLYAKGPRLFARSLPITPGTADVSWASTPPQSGLSGRTRASRARSSPATPPERHDGGRWPTAGAPQVEIVPKPTTAARPCGPTPSGRLVDCEQLDARARVWGQGAWPAARPLELRRSGSWYLAEWATHPSGNWLVASTAEVSHLTFWPLRTRYPTVVDGYSSRPGRSPSARTAGGSRPRGATVSCALAARGRRVGHGRGCSTRRPRPIGCGLAIDPTSRLLLAVGNRRGAGSRRSTAGGAKRLEGFPRRRDDGGGRLLPERPATPPPPSSSVAGKRRCVSGTSRPERAGPSPCRNPSHPPAPRRRRTTGYEGGITSHRLRGRINPLHRRPRRRPPLGPRDRPAGAVDRGPAGPGGRAPDQAREEPGTDAGVPGQRSRRTAHPSSFTTSRPTLPGRSRRLEAASAPSSSTPPAQSPSPGTRTASSVWAASRAGSPTS